MHGPLNVKFYNGTFFFIFEEQKLKLLYSRYWREYLHVRQQKKQEGREHRIIRTIVIICTSSPNVVIGGTSLDHICKKSYSENVKWYTLTVGLDANKMIILKIVVNYEYCVRECVRVCVRALDWLTYGPVAGCFEQALKFRGPKNSTIS